MEPVFCPECKKIGFGRNRFIDKKSYETHIAMHDLVSKNIGLKCVLNYDYQEARYCEEKFHCAFCQHLDKFTVNFTNPESVMKHMELHKFLDECGDKLNSKSWGFEGTGIILKCWRCCCPNNEFSSGEEFKDHIIKKHMATPPTVVNSKCTFCGHVFYAGRYGETNVQRSIAKHLLKCTGAYKKLYRHWIAKDNILTFITYVSQIQHDKKLVEKSCLQFADANIIQHIVRHLQ